MFYGENSSMVPNLLGATCEEEEERRWKRRGRLLREVGNEPHRSKTDLFPRKAACAEGDQEQTEFRHQLTRLISQKKPNVIMQFSSDDEDNDHPQTPQLHPKEQPTETQEVRKQEEPVKLTLQAPRKNNFLLAFSDDENSQDEQKSSKIEEAEEAKEESTVVLASAAKNNLILNFEEDSEEEEEGAKTPLTACKSSKNAMGAMLQRYGERYCLQRVAEGLCLQCIIKRERTSSQTRYEVYDSGTLRSILSVVKDDDGYLFHSKYGSLSGSPSTPVAEPVVAKLVSNFFGTEFNCFQWKYPCKKFADFTIDPDKSPQLITVEYETNIFGLRGPRKMTAYIPVGEPITAKKRLNEVHESEAKRQGGRSVWRFRNKTPKWNAAIGAYVLNFYGRATVSSIKNFIMVGEEEPDSADPRVLFGKFGRDLFNLDIRRPFSLLQGVAIALTSFDKKLACE